MHKLSSRRFDHSWDVPFALRRISNYLHGMPEELSNVGCQDWLVLEIGKQHNADIDTWSIMYSSRQVNQERSKFEGINRAYVLETILRVVISLSQQAH